MFARAYALDSDVHHESKMDSHLISDVYTLDWQRPARDNHARSS